MREWTRLNGDWRLIFSNISRRSYVVFAILVLSTNAMNYALIVYNFRGSLYVRAVSSAIVAQVMLSLNGDNCLRLYMWQQIITDVMWAEETICSSATRHARSTCQFYVLVIMLIVKGQTTFWHGIESCRRWMVFQLGPNIWDKTIPHFETVEKPKYSNIRLLVE